jgi:hypothetical protein
MALDRISMEMLAGHVRGSVLCLGYPDLPDGGDTIAWLKEAGASDVLVVDLMAHRGFERLLDLNHPVMFHHGTYDLVINPGTLEHCFNVGQAWTNAWLAVARGGVILHVAPGSMLNHGYWNISPIAFFDWCEANGGKVLEMRLGRNGTCEPVSIERITGSASGRGQIPAETVIYCLCKKLRDGPTRWPHQAIYRT